MMTVEEAITGRHCYRAFLPTPVPRELIARILAIAGRAPSGSNIQPWKVWVLDGAVKAAVSRELADLYGFTDVDGRLPKGPLDHGARGSAARRGES